MTNKEELQVQFAKDIYYANLRVDKSDKNFDNFIKLVNEKYINHGLYNNVIGLLIDKYIIMYNDFIEVITKHKDIMVEEYESSREHRNILTDLLNKLKSEVEIVKMNNFELSKIESIHNGTNMRMSALCDEEINNFVYEHNNESNNRFYLASILHGLDSCKIKIVYNPEIRDFNDNIKYYIVRDFDLMSTLVNFYNGKYPLVMDGSKYNNMYYKDVVKSLKKDKEYFTNDVTVKYTLIKYNGEIDNNVINQLAMWVN